MHLNLLKIIEEIKAAKFLFCFSFCHQRNVIQSFTKAEAESKDFSEEQRSQFYTSQDEAFLLTSVMKGLFLPKPADVISGIIASSTDRRAVQPCVDASPCSNEMEMQTAQYGP